MNPRLPAPSPETAASGEARQAASLREVIAAEILRSGPIPFARYMELCLYEPRLGYYSRPRERFGKAGDFYTSSDVHAVFGRLLSRQFDEMWRALGSPPRIGLIELGPGRGLFAGDVLDWSAKHFPEFFGALRYLLVEQSPHLCTRLQENLRAHIAAGKAAVFDTLEAAAGAASQTAILFANEFFDALPVEIVNFRGSVRVGYEDGRFVETFVPTSAAETDFLNRYSVHPCEGERVEVPLASVSWMDCVADAFAGRRGFAVFIDYGYTREEQLAGRHRGTIMTYRRHTAGASPYEAPGEQDITAHVTFTALRERALQRGLNPLALLTQSQLLLGIGEETQFADAFQDCALPQERTKVALQLNHLISPAGMGETFQVLLLSHGVGDVALSGMKLAR